MSNDTATTQRRAIGMILVFGQLAAGAELLLLGHTEDSWQWTPLVLIGASLTVLCWLRLADTCVALQAHRGVMALFVAGGVYGTWLHYAGNMEFELEMYPSLAGFELAREALTGATPVLAPLALAGLGLLGLTYSYQHPAAAESRASTATGE